MKRVNFTLIFISFIQFLFAQQETNYWYFGSGAGIVFNNGIPTALTNGMCYTEEGCSAISDSTGNLLFYTDGVTVWNKNQQIMFNGTGLWGDTLSHSSTQAALIVRQPLSDSIFYIFTVDGQAGYFGGYGGIAYSIVDMSLQGGIGAVTVKNAPLLTPTSEKVTAVFHNNGTDVWIATQQWLTNTKYVWLLTSTGLNPNPVTSSIGLAPVPTTSNQRAQGYMKFSPDGLKVGSVTGPAGIIEIFDFDNTTGIVSNVITLNAGNACYGMEFSPDGSRLYSTTWSSKVFQWDLTLGTQVLISNSQTLIHETPSSPSQHTTLGLQLGIDCRIYVTMTGLDSLSVIQNPNLVGLSCNYIHNAISLQGKMCYDGLPNFNQSYFNGCNTVGINEANYEGDLILFPNPFTDKINITLKRNELIDLILYDVTSRKIFNQSFTNSISINEEQLAKGIYLYEVRNKNGVIKKGKVVKE